MNVAQGEEHYVVFGQLYADCKFEAIQATVNVCVRAALEIAEVISEPKKLMTA